MVPGDLTLDRRGGPGRLLLGKSFRTARSLILKGPSALREGLQPLRSTADADDDEDVPRGKCPARGVQAWSDREDSRKGRNRMAGASATRAETSKVHALRSSHPESDRIGKVSTDQQFCLSFPFASAVGRTS